MNAALRQLVSANFDAISIKTAATALPQFAVRSGFLRFAVTVGRRIVCLRSRRRWRFVWIRDGHDGL